MGGTTSSGTRLFPCGSERRGNLGSVGAFCGVSNGVFPEKASRRLSPGYLPKMPLWAWEEKVFSCWEKVPSCWENFISCWEKILSSLEKDSPCLKKVFCCKEKVFSCWEKLFSCWGNFPPEAPASKIFPIPKLGLFGACHVKFWPLFWPLFCKHGSGGM